MKCRSVAIIVAFAVGVLAVALLIKEVPSLRTYQVVEERTWSKTSNDTSTKNDSGKIAGAGRMQLSRRYNITSSNFAALQQPTKQPITCKDRLELLKNQRWNTTGTSYTMEHGRLLREESKLLRECGMAALSGNNEFSLVPHNVPNGSSVIPYPLHLITYATPSMANTRERLIIQSILSGWFHTARGYDVTDLPEGFRRQHQDILSRPAGGGFWLWKYPIWELIMDRIPIGDYIMYADAGCLLYHPGQSTLVQQLQHMEESNSEFLVFNVQVVMATTTSERTFETFGVTRNDTRIREDTLRHGAAMYARNGPELREWLGRIYEALAVDPWIVTDRYNNDTEKNSDRFGISAYDQSLTTVTLAQLGSNVTVLPNNRLRTGKGRIHRNPIIAQRYRKFARPQLEKLKTELREKFNDSQVLAAISDGKYT